MVKANQPFKRNFERGMIQKLVNFLLPGRRKRKRLSYEDFIVNRVFESTSAKITSVTNIEIIRTLPLRDGIYEEITAALPKGIEHIKSMPNDGNLLQELTLITFNNQDGRRFAAIMYDSYDAFEAPVVVDVFTLK